MSVEPLRDSFACIPDAELNVDGMPIFDDKDASTGGPQLSDVFLLAAAGEKDSEYDRESAEPDSAT